MTDTPDLSGMELPDLIVAAVTVVDLALNEANRHKETIALRKDAGLRTVMLDTSAEGEDEQEAYEMVYDRCAYWSDYAGEGDPRDNSLEGIAGFERSYRKMKRRHVDMSRTLVRLAERNVKQLLRSPLIQVEPEVAVAILAHMDRIFLESCGGGDEIADYAWNKDTFAEMTTKLHDEAYTARWKASAPVTFAFYQGLVLSDLEIVWRMLLDRSGNPRKPMQRSRVVWGYHLEPDSCVEFGGDYSEESSREDTLQYKGSWMPDSYFYSYFLSALYDMALVFPLKPMGTHTDTYKASAFKRQHYHLDVSVEDAMDFVNRLDAGEDSMKKGTVYDNIPCLDLEMGGGRPVVKISCKKCPTTNSRAVTQIGMAPHVFLKQWSRAGWEIKGDGKKALCPTCVAAKRQQPKVEAAPILAVAPPPPLPPLHQRQSAARMVLGRTSLSPQARVAAEQRCREVDIEEGDIIRISLKAQGMNPDGSDMEEKGSDGRRRTFSLDFKREFVRRAMILETGARRRLLDANDIHPGMFRRWRQELHAAEKAAADHPAEVPEDEEEISESLIDGMIDQGVALAQHVEANLDTGEFTDDFKLEVVGTCADLDEEDQRSYLQSLDITDAMYEEWLREIEPEEQPEREDPAPSRRPGIIQDPKYDALAEALRPVPTGAPANGAAPDPALMFKLFTLFQKGIDKKRMRYNNGWSDERVAQEAEVDVEMVRAVREQTIGRILTPAMVEAVKARMAQREAKYEADVKTAREMILDLENTYDADMQAMRQEIGQ